MSINYEHIITTETGLYPPIDPRNQPAIQSPVIDMKKEIGLTLLVTALCFFLVGFIW